MEQSHLDLPCESPDSKMAAPSRLTHWYAFSVPSPGTSVKGEVSPHGKHSTTEYGETGRGRKLAPVARDRVGQRVEIIHLTLSSRHHWDPLSVTKGRQLATPFSPGALSRGCLS